MTVEIKSPMKNQSGNLMPESDIINIDSENIEVIYKGDEKILIEEITSLHGEILGNLKSSLEKGIKIGGLLFVQKARIKHGQFTCWLEKNVPFSERTARNYMSVFKESHKLKTANVSDLSQAYRFLKQLNWSHPKEIDNGDEIEKRTFITFSLDVYQKEIIMTAVEKAKELLGTGSNARAFELIAYDWFQSSADGPNLMPIEAAKRLFEKTYSVRIKIEKE